MMMPRNRHSPLLESAAMSRRHLLALPWFAATAIAHAGGHFDVDDAGTLDPGQCQFEIWAGRGGAEPITGYHFGPACRVGPIELGLNLDRFSVPGEFTYTLGPQAKWTFYGQGEESRLAAALSASLVFDVRRGGHEGGQIVLPVSWRPLDKLWVHANLGVDWAPGTGNRTGRGGVAGEWALNKQVSLIVERNRAFDIWVSRAGLRFSLSPTTSIDVSAARAGPDRTWGGIVGINYEFSRR
jgi:hypothetical protein